MNDELPTEIVSTLIAKSSWLHQIIPKEGPLQNKEKEEHIECIFLKLSLKNLTDNMQEKRKEIRYALDKPPASKMFGRSTGSIWLQGSELMVNRTKAVGCAAAGNHRC